MSDKNKTMDSITDFSMFFAFAFIYIFLVFKKDFLFNETFTLYIKLFFMILSVVGLGFSLEKFEKGDGFGEVGIGLAFIIISMYLYNITENINNNIFSGLLKILMIGLLFFGIFGTSQGVLKQGVYRKNLKSNLENIDINADNKNILIKEKNNLYIFYLYNSVIFISAFLDIISTLGFI